MIDIQVVAIHTERYHDEFAKKMKEEELLAEDAELTKIFGEDAVKTYLHNNHGRVVVTFHRVDENKCMFWLPKDFRKYRGQFKSFVDFNLSRDSDNYEVACSPNGDILSPCNKKKRPLFYSVQERFAIASVNLDRNHDVGDVLMSDVFEYKLSYKKGAEQDVASLEDEWFFSQPTNLDLPDRFKYRDAIEAAIAGRDRMMKRY